jgi:hypothetical protein
VLASLPKEVVCCIAMTLMQLPHTIVTGTDFLRFFLDFRFRFLVCNFLSLFSLIIVRYRSSPQKSGNFRLDWYHFFFCLFIIVLFLLFFLLFIVPTD